MRWMWLLTEDYGSGGPSSCQPGAERLISACPFGNRAWRIDRFSAAVTVWNRFTARFKALPYLRTYFRTYLRTSTTRR